MMWIINFHSQEVVRCLAKMFAAVLLTSYSHIACRERRFHRAMRCSTYYSVDKLLLGKGSVITRKGGGGATKRRGGGGGGGESSDVLPLQNGGVETVLALLKGRGAQQVWG